MLARVDACRRAALGLVMIAFAEASGCTAQKDSYDSARGCFDVEPERTCTSDIVWQAVCSPCERVWFCYDDGTWFGSDYSCDCVAADGSILETDDCHGDPD